MQDPHSPPFRGTTYVPGSTVTRPLLDRYSTVTRPLRDRYATVTRPLHTFFMSYRYLPGTWARLCHIASRYLPVALRYKTSIFAYIPRDMYAAGKPALRHRPRLPSLPLRLHMQRGEIIKCPPLGSPSEPTPPVPGALCASRAEPRIGEGPPLVPHLLGMMISPLRMLALDSDVCPTPVTRTVAPLNTYTFLKYRTVG
jgi:hypothetical protein